MSYKRQNRILLASLLVVALVALFPNGPAAAPTSDEAATSDESTPVPPYVVQHEWQSRLNCSVGSPFLYAAACTLIDSSDRGFIHVFQTEAPTQSFVVAMEWTSTSPATGTQLRIVLEPAGTTVGGPSFSAAEGSSPLEFRVDNLSLQDLQFRVFASGTPAGVAVDQPFTVHYHEFYGAPAPDGYSALPE